MPATLFIMGVRFFIHCIHCNFNSHWVQYIIALLALSCPFTIHSLRCACTLQHTHMHSHRHIMTSLLWNMIYGEKYIQIYKIIKVGRPGEMPSVCRTPSRKHTHTGTHILGRVHWHRCTGLFLWMYVHAHVHTHPQRNTRSLINGCGDCVAPRHPFRDRLPVVEYVWHIQISPARSHCIS